MPEWEVFNDNVLVYGRGTADERKLEGAAEVADALNLLSCLYRDERSRFERSWAHLREFQDILLLDKGYPPDELPLPSHLARVDDLKAVIAQRDAAKLGAWKADMERRGVEERLRSLSIRLAESSGHSVDGFSDQFTPLDALIYILRRENKTERERDAAMEALEQYERVIQAAFTYPQKWLHVPERAQELYKIAREAREKVLKEAGEWARVVLVELEKEPDDA